LTNRIKELRVSKKITQANLAEYLGIAQNTLSYWEQGKYDIDTKSLKKISDFFNCSIDYVLGKETEVESNAALLENKKIRLVPVFESVSAGFGTMAIDDIISYQPCYIESDTEASETICVIVRGDSMAPKIEDGDLIQVHKQTSVDSGSFAVVLLDGEEALVKKVYYGKDWIELHSINPLYKVMRFEGPDVLRLQVIGLVRSVIKRL
jgi:repressor LexA